LSVIAFIFSAHTFLAAEGFKKSPKTALKLNFGKLPRRLSIQEQTTRGIRPSTRVYLRAKPSERNKFFRKDKGRRLRAKTPDRATRQSTFSLPPLAL
jgi:hypothetical protein